LKSSVGLSLEQIQRINRHTGKNFKCLGRKAVIVINGGANGIGSKRNQMNGVQKLQKYNNTNIKIVNIPFRYDMDRNSATNLEIQSYNRNLNKVAKAFSHVTTVETDMDRKYFTQHGMHLNNTGKEWLSKLIATQIYGLVKSNNNKEKPVIVLNWKDEPTNKQIPVNIHPIFETSLGQNNGNQADSGQKGVVTQEKVTYSRTSGRKSKQPVTSGDDFLWIAVSITRV
jgi:hypothetical protein